jgi:hypothetical protein
MAFHLGINEDIYTSLEGKRFRRQEHLLMKYVKESNNSRILILQLGKPIKVILRG